MHKFNVGDYIRNEYGDKAYLIVDVLSSTYTMMKLDGTKIRYDENIKDIDREYIFIGKM